MFIPEDIVAAIAKDEEYSVENDALALLVKAMDKEVEKARSAIREIVDIKDDNIPDDALSRYVKKPDKEPEATHETM